MLFEDNKSFSIAGTRAVYFNVSSMEASNISIINNKNLANYACRIGETTALICDDIVFLYNSGLSGGVLIEGKV